MVVASDHGEKIGLRTRLHGTDLDEELVRVLLVIAGCGFEHGQVDAPVGLIDTSPTVLAMTRTPGPSWLDGLDLGTTLPERRLLHADLWRFNAKGQATLDMSGVIDGEHMMTFDLLSNTISTKTFAGKTPASVEANAALESEIRGYLETTQGRLRPR